MKRLLLFFAFIAGTMLLYLFLQFAFFPFIIQLACKLCPPSLNRLPGDTYYIPNATYYLSDLLHPIP